MPGGAAADAAALRALRQTDWRKCRLLQAHRHALHFISGRRTLGVAVEGEHVADGSGRDRESRDAGAFVAGRDIAEQTQAFQEEMIGRVRYERNADLQVDGAISIFDDPDPALGEEAAGVGELPF